MRKPYDHKAVEWINEDGGRECLACPTPITGLGHTLRHVDEAIRPCDVDPADRTTITNLTDLGARALAEMWTEVHCNDVDRARVVIEALYRAGALNTKTARRRVRAAA